MPGAEAESSHEGPRLRWEIFLVALAVFLLEISYTRIFSFKLFYYFTYLIIGVVMLGLGGGAVGVALVPRLREIPAARLVPTCCLLTAAAVAGSYLVVAGVQLDVFHVTESFLGMLKLTALVGALFTPFLLVGIVLATIFGARPHDIPRLYFADLMGAALACALVVPLLRLLTPPGCIAAAALILTVVPLVRAYRVQPVTFWCSAVLAGCLALAVAVPSRLPQPVPDPIKTMSPQKLQGQNVLFSQWDPVFRIDVLGHREAPFLFVIHDGLIGSGMHRFDGNFSALTRFDTDFRALPFELLPENPRVLIIGAAGGHEILASLYLGAGEVVAVELNPVTVSLLRKHFADYTGRIAFHDRVRLVNAEGRSYLAQDDSRYDLIWFVAPDSYSAMNAATSGAFVMSESYLYTTEMIEESLAHLAPGGKICAQFGEHQFHKWPTRTARYLTTAREAFRRSGIEDFERHTILSTAPGVFTNATILLGRDPIGESEIARYRAKLSQVERGVLWHPRDAGDGELPPANRAISLPPDALAEWLDEAPYAVHPITDDSPFFWHFARFSDLIRSYSGDSMGVFDPELGTGERMLMALLLIVTVFAAVFLLLPLLLVRDTWQHIPYKGRVAVYFAALGLGFMFFEVSLIQKLTLFLGYPTYALTVTLFCLLAFSGLGSFASERYARKRNTALVGLLAGLVVLTAVYQLAAPGIVASFVGSSLAVRVAVTTALLAPLGLCLGAFLPIGLATVSGVTTHQKEFIAWGWAVNGFFSVMSSVLSTLLSMTFGFDAVLYLGLAIYFVGASALWRVPAPR